MIRLGLRMALGTGRDALLRLAVIAAAVALGVGMLLATLAALNATGTQNARNGWLNTGRVPAQAQPGADPLWWQIAADGFQGRLVGRIDVAATGPHSPVPPGMPRLPGPGEFYASPAMAELLRDTPAAQLADRYPGRLAGTIGKAALPGPDSLVIVIGHRPDELAGQRNATEVKAIASSSPSSCSGPSCTVGTNSNGMKLILSVVAAAMIFPVLVLIGTATRLSAAAREQRFAAMRLVGATPRQIAVVSTVESTVAAAAGVAAGFGLYEALRPLLVKVDFTRTPFFLSDLSLSVADVAVVALGVPLAAALSARLALRRVRISPLGVTRRTTPRPPRAYRLIPLVAGLVELACFIGHRPPTSTGQVRAFLPGILVVLGGLVVAGPWLTMAGARLMAARARRAAGLVAGRRLSDDPKAGFRAVSGLVLALCVTTAAVGIIDAMVHERGLPGTSKAVRDTVASDHRDFTYHRIVGTGVTPPDSLLAALRAVPGVGGVLVVHADPGGDRNAPYSGGLVDCAQLATVPVYGACAQGARTASFNTGVDSYGLDHDHSWPTRWPAAATTPEELRGLPVVQVAVTTDGSRSAVETVRTLLARAYPADDPPYTVAEQRAADAQELDSYRRLADVVIAVSFPVAGCSLAVAVAGGIGDRKRPFSLLRLTGVRLRTLRQVVLLESAVPMLAVAVVAVGTGFLAAQLFLKAQLGYSLQPPGPEYYVMVGGGIVAALAVIGATLPLLTRVTGPENARNE
ncbi:ABC transporter permease [Streptomyces sp. NRRL F-5123]|uniref:ABC transporter permease n=1 Tax=Streptomyces sp. NRRL F-5123 TaxID=1463856 RepID=UPI0004E1E93C|nr:FtsX-like permease family protein [Streptomyces sp. NRRL F-5123]